jgi:hypothetical protein
MRISVKHLHLDRLHFCLRFIRQHHVTGPISAKAIRQSFIDYFVDEHDHTFLRSSPVVPLCDPSLAFVNAGMNQVLQILLVIFVIFRAQYSSGLGHCNQNFHYDA